MLGKGPNQSPISLTLPHLDNPRSFDECLRSDNELSDRCKSRFSNQRYSKHNSRHNVKHSKRHSKSSNRLNNKHNDRTRSSILYGRQRARCSRGQNREGRWNGQPKGTPMCDCPWDCSCKRRGVMPWTWMHKSSTGNDGIWVEGMGRNSRCDKVQSEVWKQHPDLILGNMLWGRHTENGCEGVLGYVDLILDDSYSPMEDSFAC